LSEGAVSYDFEQLEPSAPPPRDLPARMLSQANEEAGQIRELARAEGHAEGLATGREDSRAEISAAVAAFGEALSGIEGLRLEVAGAVEQDAIELALALAGKILAGALQARPELVVEVVQGALRRLSDRRRITVVVNPADLDTVTAALGDVQSHASGIEHCDLQSDPRVTRGSAIVRTAEGEVDASVETQLVRAREVVAAELAGGGEPLP
jgi:flagellar assembly protein FliH